MIQIKLYLRRGDGKFYALRNLALRTLLAFSLSFLLLNPRSPPSPSESANRCTSPARLLIGARGTYTSAGANSLSALSFSSLCLSPHIISGHQVVRGD